MPGRRDTLPLAHGRASPHTEQRSPQVPSVTLVVQMKPPVKTVPTTQLPGHLALLQKQELRLELVNVLESMTDGFVALDSDWRITYVNAAAERQNGLTRESLLGRTHWEAFPATVGTNFERQLRRGMAERVRLKGE